MNPYQRPTEQHFRNKTTDATDSRSYSSASIPQVQQLNRSSAVYMQNVDNNRTYQYPFQPNEDLSESLGRDYNNFCD